MKDTSKTGLTQGYRKKRVQRIKKIIIITCITLLILPTVLSIFLMCRVFSLERRLDRALDTIAVSQSEEKETAKAKEAEPVPTATAQSVTPAAVQIDENKKKVYLTFDDGPSTETEKILDILKENQVKATFFVTGKEDAYSKKMYQRIVKEGHTLAMHSYSHLYDDIYSSADAFAKDVDSLVELLKKETGVMPTFYRFPGGSNSQMIKIPFHDLTAVLEQRNLVYMDWNVLSPDGKSGKTTKKKVIEGIMTDTERFDTAVVLMYDSPEKPLTVKALPELIQKMKKANYELLPIDDTTAKVRHNK